MRVAGPWRLHSPNVCKVCGLDDIVLVDSAVETVRCRHCSADREGYGWLDTDTPCRHCFRSKRIVAWEHGAQIVARCSACTLERGNLDHVKYGTAFGRHIASAKGRRSRHRPTESTRALVARVTAGECVHHLLRSIGVLPKFTPVPDRFYTDAPARQLSLESFSDSTGEDFALTWTHELPRHEHDDHIIGLAIHDRLARTLTDAQSRRMRVVWLVPSCAECNQRRARGLEDVAYLVTVFGLFLRAAGLEYHEEAEEVRMFVDAVKLAHVHVRLEASFRRRASGT
jgi:hypothetical protein